MRILITGATGMLGLDVQSATAAAGHDCIALSHAVLDITDSVAVTEAIAASGAEAVINCAGYTNVDGAESDAHAAHAANGAGAGNVAAAAARAGAWTVHVSSDYVFDGTKATAYVESDATGPLSVYGASKLAGERAVAAVAPDSHTIVRSSWLFGPGGHCFPATIMRLATERDELRVVDDQRGCPTFTPHLAGALVSLATSRALPGILHVAGAGECTWYEFARAIVELSDTAAEVRPCTTAEFPRPARRPACSVLRSERGPAVPVLPPWQQGLAEYCSARVAGAPAQ